MFGFFLIIFDKARIECINLYTRITNQLLKQIKLNAIKIRDIENKIMQFIWKLNSVGLYPLWWPDISLYNII